MNNDRSTIEGKIGPSEALGTGMCLRLIVGLALLCPTLAVGQAPKWSGAMSAGGNGATIARAVKVAPDNNYYVTGEFSSNATFSKTTLASQGGSDIFLAKYAVTGKLLWIVSAGGTSDDVGFGIDLDSEGNVYVTGWFFNSATFNSVDSAPKTVTGIGNTIFLAKYTPWGNLQWIETGATDNSGLDNFGYGVAVDSWSHTVFIAALGQDNTTFSSENGTVHTIPGSGAWHMVLAKYSTSGKFEWAQTDWPGGNSIPRGVAVDSSGSAYVTGWYEDETTFTSANGNNITVPGFSPADATGDYPDDAFLAKYDKDGNTQWVNHAGGYKAIGNQIAIGPEGEISIAGLVGNIDFGTAGEAKTIVTSSLPGKNINLGGGHFTDPFNIDAFIATYNSSGVLQRAIRFGNTNAETFNGIAYDSSDNLYVAGLVDKTPALATLIVQKYSDGKLQWERNADYSSLWAAEGEPPAIAVRNGRILVTGGFQGSFDFGKFELSGTGTADMFLAELPTE